MQQGHGSGFEDPKNYAGWGDELLSEALRVVTRRTKNWRINRTLM